MSSPPTITLLHGRTTYTLPIPDTLHQLQSAIESLTQVSISSQRLLVSGRTLSAPPNTKLSTLGVSKRKKLMLLGRPPISSPSSPPSSPSKLESKPTALSPNMQKVHACQKQVMEMETRLQDVERQWDGQQAREEEKSRLKQETLVLSEGFMKVLLTLDCIVEEAGEGRTSTPGEWKSERKALVKRVQANLERCDALGKGGE